MRARCSAEEEELDALNWSCGLAASATQEQQLPSQQQQQPPPPLLLRLARLGVCIFRSFCLQVMLVNASCEALLIIMKLHQKTSNTSLFGEKLDAAFIYQNAPRTKISVRCTRRCSAGDKPQPTPQVIYSATAAGRARLSLIQTGFGMDQSRLPNDIKRRRQQAKLFKQKRLEQQEAHSYLERARTQRLAADKMAEQERKEAAAKKMHIVAQC